MNFLTEVLQSLAEPLNACSGEQGRALKTQEEFEEEEQKRAEAERLEVARRIYERENDRPSRRLHGDKPDMNLSNLRRMKLAPGGRLIISPITVKNLRGTRPGATHIYVRAMIGGDIEGLSRSVELERDGSAAWKHGEDQVFLVVNRETAKYGRSAALQVEVWGDGALTSSMSPLAQDGDQGAIAGRLYEPVASANIALNQLALGVPGQVQLPLAMNPAVLRGELDLLITYEPPIPGRNF